MEHGWAKCEQNQLQVKLVHNEAEYKVPNFGSSVKTLAEADGAHGRAGHKHPKLKTENDGHGPARHVRETALAGEVELEPAVKVPQLDQRVNQHQEEHK